MSPASSEPQRHTTRFLPPMAGGQQKTGWEALEKWVGSGGSGQKAGGDEAPAAPSGKTGWEALEKWVGSGGSGQPAQAAEAAPAAPSGKTGWEALEKWVGSGSGQAAAPAAAAAPSGKTGWEALEKWVGSGGAGQAAPQPAAANGPAAADRLADSVERQVGELKEEVSTLPQSQEPAKSGGLGGFLKRLFGGR